MQVNQPSLSPIYESQHPQSQQEASQQQAAESPLTPGQALKARKAKGGAAQESDGREAVSAQFSAQLAAQLDPKAALGPKSGGAAQPEISALAQQTASAAQADAGQLQALALSQGKQAQIAAQSEGKQAQIAAQARAQASVKAQNAAGGESSSGEVAGKDYPDFLKNFTITRDQRSPQIFDTGVKPWSKDFVFEGGGHMDPRMTPLMQPATPGAPRISAKGPAGQQAIQSHEADIQSLLARIQALGGEGDQVMVSSAAPVAAQTQARPAKMGGDEFLQTLQSVQPRSDAQSVAGMSQAARVDASQFGQGSSGQSGSQLGGGGGRKFQVISGGGDLIENRRGSLDPSSLAPVYGMREPQPIVAPVALLTGHVTQGAATRERLSSESLMGMSNNIRTLQSQGGGEMRIRLKPDNLGELKMQIMTRGNEVGLKIEATSERSKKVLEESLGYLRDSLAGQNLKLGGVDVKVVSMLSSGSQGDLGNNPNPQNQGNQSGQNFQNLGAWLGQQDAQAGNGRSGRSSGSDSDDGFGARRGSASTVSPAAFATGRSASAAMAQDGRLDVRA